MTQKGHHNLEFGFIESFRIGLGFGLGFMASFFLLMFILGLMGIGLFSAIFSGIF